MATNRFSIEVFAAGTWTDANGVTRTYTTDELESIARTYNEQNDHTAPVVYGHPVDNTPAQGWVDKLFVHGSKLYATVRDLSAEFIEGVKKGQWRKKSIALYEDGLLRHVGFVPIPAVKGLSDAFTPALFDDGGRSYVEFASTFPPQKNETPKAKGKTMDEAQLAEMTGKMDSMLNLLTQIANKLGAAPVAPGAPVAPQPAGFAPPMFNEAQLNEYNTGLASQGYRIVPVDSASKGNSNEVEALRAQLNDVKRSEFSEYLKSAPIAARVPLIMRDQYVDWLMNAFDADEKAKRSGANFSESNPSEVDKIKSKLSQLPELVNVGGEFAENGRSVSGAQSTSVDQQTSLGKAIAGARRNGARAVSTNQ